MIEFGATCLLTALAIMVLCCVNHVADLLDAVTHHRQAQGDSVMKHAGLLEYEEDDA